MERNPYWIIFFLVNRGLLKLGLAGKPYEGAQVWRSTVRDLGDLEVFKSLVASQDISVWSLSPTRADYLVHDNKRTKVNRALLGQNMNHTVIIMSVQQRIDMFRTNDSDWDDSSLRTDSNKTVVGNWNRRRDKEIVSESKNILRQRQTKVTRFLPQVSIGHRLDFKNYPSTRILDEYLDYLAENYQSICQIKSIGITAENRSIRMIKISNGDPTNEVIVLQGGLHAREWIGITTPLYIANNIITKYDQQPLYMKNKDWYIIPLANPDGYAHTHTVDRLWRKNRSKNSHCIGVDLNRNFAKFWTKSSLSGNSNECGEDFSGPYAFSERETKALRDLLTSIKKTPKAYVDFHAFGQMILYPWGVKNKYTKDQRYLETTAELIKMAIRKATRYIYSHGIPSNILYEAYGCAMDWFHSQGISLSYAIESRDTGNYGFLLPPDQIESAGKELLGAIRAIAKGPGINMREGEQHSWF